MRFNGMNMKNLIVIIISLLFFIVQINGSEENCFASIKDAIILREGSVAIDLDAFFRLGRLRWILLVEPECKVAFSPVRFCNLNF